MATGADPIIRMTGGVVVPAGHALVEITRVEGSSMRTTTRVSRGRRCSLRRYHVAFIDAGGGVLPDRQRGYTYADGDLSHVVAKAAQRGSFTAVLRHPRSARPEIVAVVDHAAAAATARRARMAAEDAEWEASAPRRRTDDVAGDA